MASKISNNSASAPDTVDIELGASNWEGGLGGMLAGFDAATRIGRRATFAAGTGALGLRFLMPDEQTAGPVGGRPPALPVVSQVLAGGQVQARNEEICAAHPPGARAGTVRPNDRFVAINGVSCAEMSKVTFMQMLAGRPCVVLFEAGPPVPPGHFDGAAVATPAARPPPPVGSAPYQAAPTMATRGPPPPPGAPPAVHRRYAAATAALLVPGAPPRRRHQVMMLMGASMNGNVGEVRALLAAGADPAAGLDGGFTPLMWASSYGHSEVVAALLAAGADPAARDNDGHTALMKASEGPPPPGGFVEGDEPQIEEGGHVRVVAALLAAGADPAALDKGGRTALMRASEHGHAEVVRALLAAGAQHMPDPAAAAKRRRLLFNVVFVAVGIIVFLLVGLPRTRRP